jgi:hypothetical protein
MPDYFVEHPFQENLEEAWVLPLMTQHGLLFHEAELPLQLNAVEEML